MERNLAETAGTLVYVPKFREYGIRINDGGSSYIVIRICPWCGSKLPQSLRDEWFDRLEALNLEPNDRRIPPSLLTDAWWKSEPQEPTRTR
jgi:hypothetical protein